MIHNKQVIKDDLATLVEQGIFDLNSSVQLQDKVVDNFSCEGTVPLYIYGLIEILLKTIRPKQQNGHQFGYVPLNNLKLYHGPKEYPFYFTSA